jgi:hypothetical protein
MPKAFCSCFSFIWNGAFAQAGMNFDPPIYTFHIAEAAGVNHNT